MNTTMSNRHPGTTHNDITADSFPFDNAVNVAEVKIFRPQNRKLNWKTMNPFFAISQTGVPLSEKQPTKEDPKIYENPKIKMEIEIMNRIQMKNTFFNCTLSCFP